MVGAGVLLKRLNESGKVRITAKERFRPEQKEGLERENRGTYGTGEKIGIVKAFYINCCIENRIVEYNVLLLLLLSTSNIRIVMFMDSIWLFERDRGGGLDLFSTGTSAVSI